MHNIPISELKLLKIHTTVLLIDKNETYLIGASLKDLDKKMFTFSML